MRQLKFIAGIFIILIFANSCKDDFTLPADWKDIPIVYGILQVGEGNHYIRVEKAFLDPNLSPLTTAKNPDSIYYKNATVELVKLETGETFQLEKVNAADEGFTRDEGTFATDPNYIYKIAGNRLNLAGGEQIELRIKRNETSEAVTAQTTVLPTMSVTSPNNPQINSWDEFSKATFGWKPETEEAVIFDIELVFNYQEKLDGQPVENKSISWTPVRNRVRSDAERTSIQLVEKISGDAFFQFVGESIDETVSARRIPLGIDLFIYGGGSEIKDFFDISLANGGVTGSQDPPVYSNISGDGRGIFSSKSQAVMKNIILTAKARDSLLTGRYTRDLRFE